MKAMFQISREFALVRAAFYELFAVLSNYIANEDELAWTKQKIKVIQEKGEVLARNGYRIEVKPLVDALDSISELEEVQADYVNLFDLPKPNHALSPFESMQRGEGVLLGQRTKEVQDYYLEFGLEIADGFKELPDHVTAELAFMSFLCAEEAKALSQEPVWHYQAGQHHFLNNHTMKWVPDLFAKVSEQTSTELYHVFPDLVNKFLVQDFDRVTARFLRGKQ
ncbi:MAG: TorD/DmsD family molecular chaperone [Desulfitobacteriaceae bacterium]